MKETLRTAIGLAVSGIAFALAAFLVAPPLASGNILILDPNTGTYVAPAPADRAPAPAARPLTDEEKARNAETFAAMEKYLRLFRYAFVGVGAQSSRLEQVGSGSEVLIPAATLGLDIDGLLLGPLALELTGKFAYGSGASFGESFMMLYLEIPVWGGFPVRRPRYGTPAIDAETRKGKPAEDSVRENWQEFTRWGSQYFPVRFGLGIGYGGMSMEQEGGTATVGGAVQAGKASFEFAGMPVAARIGYFGESDMVRLTGYLVTSSFVSNVNIGSYTGFEVPAKGKYFEGKVDWYHRFDRRIAERNFLTGMGVSIVYRDACLEGVSATIPGFLGGVPVVFPETETRQVEVYLTVGYMR